jgi:hypothetical protein
MARRVPKTPTKISEARELARAATEIKRAVADLTSFTKAAQADGDMLPGALAEKRVLSTGTVLKLFDISKVTFGVWRQRFGLKPAFCVAGRYYWAERDIEALRKRLEANPLKPGRPPMRREETDEAQAAASA